MEFVGVVGRPIVVEDAVGVERIGVERPVEGGRLVDLFEIVHVSKMPEHVFSSEEPACFAHDDGIVVFMGEKSEPLFKVRTTIVDGYIAKDGHAVGVWTEDDVLFR